jgi:hypothetical protein
MRDPAPTYSPPPKKSSAAKPLTWQQLAYALRNKTEDERAAVAAQLVVGTIPLAPPTERIAAQVCRTTPYRVHVALNGHNGNGHRNGKIGRAEYLQQIASFRTALAEAVRWGDGFQEDDAARLAWHVIDSVISSLRHDPRWATVPRSELELLLGDTRRRVEEDLMWQLKGYGPVDEILEPAVALADELMTKVRFPLSMGQNL